MIALLLGILFGTACLLLGVVLGLRMAVLNTRTRGYFKAYGKKWRAAEVHYVPEEP